MGRIALTIGLALAGASCTFGSADGRRASSPDPGEDDGTTGVADTGSALTGLPLDTGADDGTTSAVSATGTISESTGSGSVTTGDTTGAGTSTGGDRFVLCDDADPDLRACYDFADVASGTLSDLSMYQNDGSVSGVGIEPGPFGDAVRLSAAAEIAVPDSPSLDLEGPLSVEAWVYIESLPTRDRVGIVDNDGQYSAMLYAEEGIRCHGGSAFASTPAFPLGTWFHLACVHDGTGIEVWVDAQLEGTGEGNDPVATDNPSPLAIGDSSPEYNVPIDGLVAAVRVWSSVRTPGDIQAAAEATM